MAAILGLDYGSARVGVGVSDDEERVAVPVTVLANNREPELLDALRALVAEKAAAMIVVGLPLSLRGTRTAQTKASVHFAHVVRRATGLPVELWDERLSSVAAKRGGVRGRDDAAAAAVMLQAFLDSRYAAR